MALYIPTSYRQWYDEKQKGLTHYAAVYDCPYCETERNALELRCKRCGFHNGFHNVNLLIGARAMPIYGGFGGISGSFKVVFETEAAKRALEELANQ